jgi:hypothetical protein
MRKFAALILVLLLAAPAALAGNLPIGGRFKEPPAPEAAATPAPSQAPDDRDAFSDPTTRYADFVDPADPASVWFLRMADSVNDETGLAPAGMAVRRVDYAVDESGAATLKSTIILYDTAYGYVIQVADESEYPGMVLYMFPETLAILYDGAVLTDPSGYEVSEDTLSPDRFLNTYDPAETLLAVRAEGDGYAYLTDSGDGRLFEYITDAGLKYSELLAYHADADGAWYLNGYATVEIVEAPELPDVVIAAME